VDSRLPSSRLLPQVKAFAALFLKRNNAMGKRFALFTLLSVPHKKDEENGDEDNKGGADEGESEAGRKRLKRKR
jgi:hypothetical protein